MQLLQLVHGRVDESLRVPGTLPALRALVAGGYVGRDDGETLLRGYRFLRGVEHRLQLQNLRRTHTVPDDPHGRALAGRLPRLHRAARPGRRRGVPLRLGRARRAGPPPARQAALPAAARSRRPGAGRGAADDPRIGPQAAGDPRLRRPGRRAASPAGAHRRRDPDRRDPADPAADAAAGVRRRAGARSRPAQLPARCPTSWAARRGICGCCATPARSPAGWPGCSASPGTRPTCSPATRRRCACSPTTPSCSRAPGSRCWTASPRPPNATPDDADKATAAVRALRRRELFRLACADILSRAGDLAPAHPLDVTRSASPCPTSPTPRSTPRCGWPRRSGPARPACASRSSGWAGSADTR